MIKLVGSVLILLASGIRWAAFFPSVNKGELAVLYCFVFLFIATRDAVKWGLDRVFL